ncbi:MAG: hypothetical protein CL811_06400 [Colwelliaceae bacterium]|jgi:hypothetical protein|nr:hypothetical protein [Colwelliaceae bacterium]
MGKDYIPLGLNGLDLKKAFDLLINRNCLATSIYGKPKFIDVSEIEIGQHNTKESIIRLHSGGFFVVEGTINKEELV